MAQGGGTGSTTFAYDSQGQRDYETSALQGTRYYGPAGYELADGVSKHELGPVIVSRIGAVDTVTVVLKDRLGSTLDAIDGATVNRRSYDAFGATRNGDMSTRTNGTLNLTPDTIHGFTNHTHEDDVALINMGGRVYDYTLGRFLNVDPIVQSPASSQSLNPYSYIGNNPLSGKDPTGYQACTGSNIDRGPSTDCHDQGVSSTQIATPSLGQMKAAVARRNGRENQASRVVTPNVQEVTASSNTPINNTATPTKPQAAKADGAEMSSDEANTLPSVTVNSASGATLNADQEATVRRMTYSDVQAGKNPSNETILFMDDKGNVLERTQNGCNGVADMCTTAPAPGTTAVGHSHVYQQIPSGVNASTRRMVTLSRDMPGRGDAGSLSQGIPGAVWTPGGYKYAIEGTSAHPIIRYLQGGDPRFGAFVQSHWKPNNNELLFRISNDYLSEGKQ